MINTIEFKQEEIEFEGEMFYLDIEIEIESYGSPAITHLLPEDCDPGSGAEWSLGEVSFNVESHPILSKVQNDFLKAKMLEAANHFCDKNADKIEEKIEQHGKDQSESFHDYHDED